MKIVGLCNIKTNTMINGHKIMKYKKLDIYFNSVLNPKNWTFFD